MKATSRAIVLVLASVFGLMGSTSASAYTSTCIELFGSPFTSGNWTQGDSLLYTYFHFDWEFTYLPTGAYTNGSPDGTVPSNQADYIAAWVQSPSPGWWGIDGELDMSYFVFEPVYKVVSGGVQDCAADVLI